MRRVLFSWRLSFDSDTAVSFCVIPKRTSKGPVDLVNPLNPFSLKGCRETRKLRVSQWIQLMTGGFRWIWKLSHLYFFGRSLEVVKSAMNMFDEIATRYREVNGQSRCSYTANTGAYNSMLESECLCESHATDIFDIFHSSSMSRTWWLNHSLFLKLSASWMLRYVSNHPWNTWEVIPTMDHSDHSHGKTSNLLKWTALMFRCFPDRCEDRESPH